MGEPEGRAAAAVRYAPPRARRAGEPATSGYAQVRRSIYLLYKRLPPGAVDAYRLSIPPGEVTVRPYEDLPAGTHRVARALVAHLRMPRTRIATEFRPLPAGRAAVVTLGPGPDYRVEIDVRFARRRGDLGAVLAHEVMHVFLKERGLRSEDEILVDTASAYLGVGWPLLDATGHLGYLDPAVLGYALGKRAVRFGDDPTPWLGSARARSAYAAGYARAADEPCRPPFHRADPRRRRRYAKDRARARGADGYAFSGRSPVNVTFACPTCGVRITAPVGDRFRFRCAVCRTALDCAT